MTDELADAILDWVDADDDPRTYGIESDLYELMTPPYSAKNGPIDSIDELLMVDGVTAELLYGEDANRNGLLDPNENDGTATLPNDNADGILDLGWSAYLTGYSRESNLRPDGTSKINVNQSLLTDLYDQMVEEEIDESIAQFIIAYRVYGAINVEPLDSTGLESANTTGDTQTDDALQRLAEGLARSLTGGGDGSVTRGGIDCTQGASTDIDSLFELLGAEVRGAVDGVETTLVSPFQIEPEGMAFLFENFTTSPVTRIDGRININEARLEVLIGIPGIAPDLPEAIVASRPVSEDGTLIADLLAQRQHTGWLLLEGLTDLTTMRLIDRYVTTGGEVYRLQVIGRFTGGGPSSRVEAVIDASEDLPKVLFRRDLGDLGAGYVLEQLQGATNN
ncbi:MAG: type II secretion system protein GspK [Planctomycetaceae bacterium]